MKDNKDTQKFEKHQKNLNISGVMNSVLSDIEVEVSEYQKLINLNDKYGETDKTKILRSEWEGAIKGLTFAIETLKKYYS